MKYSVSVATLVLLVLLGAASGAALSSIVASPSSSNSPFTIDAPVVYGINEFTLLEVDDGDNNEEDVITEILHEFVFESKNAGDVVTWDFGDGMISTGPNALHSYALPGHYIVTATSTSVDSIQVSSVEITVELQSSVESDNMECVCAPTAKSTVIDLRLTPGMVSLEGIVTVEHDGSSESCSMRNPLQECHVRVILEHTVDGAVVEQEVLFDDTFRSNELSIPFEMLDLEIEPGEGMQFRLETDQVRDWHKPNTEWSMTAPA
tara:strand:+ start:4149 stop:4937 length:789 start_codon:yes stop_codon:yes gene_type:complete